MVVHKHLAPREFAHHGFKGGTHPRRRIVVEGKVKFRTAKYFGGLVGTLLGHRYKRRRIARAGLDGLGGRVRKHHANLVPRSPEVVGPTQRRTDGVAVWVPVCGDEDLVGSLPKGLQYVVNHGVNFVLLQPIYDLNFNLS